MYRENVAALRNELAALMRMQRIQQRIGGGGNRHVPVTTNPQDRAEIGALIQRYRFGILTWCRQTLATSTYGQHLPASRRPSSDIDLLRRVTRTLNSTTSPLPSLDDLTSPARFPLVEHWRHAARATALGEHDLAGTSAGALDLTQARAVVSDAAEVVSALVVLDARYTNIPGWETLLGAAGLRRAAEACLFLDPSDDSTASLGWRPALRPVEGAGRDGIAGVLQAEYNLLVHLQELPTVLNLRRITLSQRQVSAIAAAQVARDHPELGASWSHRSDVYSELGHRLRNIDGLAGSGGLAAAEAANAVNRMRALAHRGPVAERDLQRLDKLFTAVDRRIIETVRTGAVERIYFARVTLPRLDTADGRPVHQVRERFRPMPYADQRDLIGCFDGDRPTSAPPPDDGSRSRFRWAVGIGDREGPDAAPPVSL